MNEKDPKINSKILDSFIEKAKIHLWIGEIVENVNNLDLHYMVIKQVEVKVSLVYVHLPI